MKNDVDIYRYICRVSKKPLDPYQSIVFEEVRVEWQAVRVPVCQCHGKAVIDQKIVAYSPQYLDAVEEAGLFDGDGRDQTTGF